uniref:Uncharacterized protein n=1 Tax=Marseillevirus sp. TaxID=2809551 RepID=A0AA96EL22_9VIRU|nr:hypothetical protein MarFTMF_066 [Marseillevirus sp.]
MQQKVREFLVRKGVAEKDIKISKSPWLCGSLGGAFSCKVKSIGVKISWREWGEGDKTEFGFQKGVIKIRDENAALSILKEEIRKFSGYRNMRKEMKRKAKKQLLEDVRILKEKVSFLEGKVLEFEYAPGGSKAKEIEAHFESLSRGQ